MLFQGGLIIVVDAESTEMSQVSQQLIDDQAINYQGGALNMYTHAYIGNVEGNKGNIYRQIRDGFFNEPGGDVFESRHFYYTPKTLDEVSALFAQKKGLNPLIQDSSTVYLNENQEFILLRNSLLNLA